MFRSRGFALRRGHFGALAEMGLSGALDVRCGLGFVVGRLAGVEVTTGSSLSRWALCASAPRTKLPLATVASMSAVGNN